MRGRAALLLAAALAPLANAQAPLPYELFHVEDPGRWGQPKRIVQPDYPKAALEKGLGGYVDVEGTVTPLQELRDAEYRAGSPDAEVFVPALKEVIPHWTFYVPVGDDCMPAERRATNRIWFEVVDGKPKVTVTRRRDAERPPTGAMLRPIERTDPMFPWKMQRSGLQALVYSRVDIAPSGEVAGVVADAYPKDARRDRSAFEQETRESLGKWKWPAVDDPTRKRAACYEVFYVFRN